MTLLVKSDLIDKLGKLTDEGEHQLVSVGNNAKTASVLQIIANSKAHSAFMREKKQETLASDALKEVGDSNDQLTAMKSMAKMLFHQKNQEMAQRDRHYYARAANEFGKVSGKSLVRIIQKPSTKEQKPVTKELTSGSATSTTTTNGNESGSQLGQEKQKGNDNPTTPLGNGVLQFTNKNTSRFVYLHNFKRRSDGAYSAHGCTRNGSENGKRYHSEVVKFETDFKTFHFCDENGCIKSDDVVYELTEGNSSVIPRS